MHLREARFDGGFRERCSGWKRWAFVFVTAVVATGCMPQTLLTSTAPSAEVEYSRPLARVLVIVERLGPSDRRTVEDQLVADMKAKGVDARPWSALFTTPPTDRETTRGVLVANGYDGALVVSLEDIVEEQCGELGGCWHYRSGFMTQERYVTMQARLWDVRKGDHIVWKAQTETMNPTDRKDLARNVSSTIVPELSRVKLVVPSST